MFGGILVEDQKKTIHQDLMQIRIIQKWKSNKEKKGLHRHSM